MLQSVTTALRLLEYLARTPSAGVSEMSRDLDITTGTAYRLVRTLVGTGFAEQDPRSKQYRLSLKLQLLAAQARPGEDLLSVARPFLERLSAQTGETVNLGVLLGGDVVYLDKIPSRELMAIEMRVGSQVAAHCTALGKAMLALASKDEQEAYIAQARWQRITPSTVSSAKALRSALVQVAEAGYAVDESEILEDVRCVAAAIVGTDGRAVGAISITAPRSRFEDKRQHLIGAVVQAAAGASALFHSTDVA